LQTRGAIYHHTQLVFHNGFVGKKYIILLNSPANKDPYLFVKATSQQKHKPSRAGCIKERSLFFIPAGKTFFKKDTWVQLYELYEFTPDAAGKTFFKKDTWVQLYELYEFTPDEIDNNKEMTVEGSLNVKMIDDIVNCLFLSEEDNIAGIHKELLRPPLQDSLLKLKDKFNKTR